MNEREFGRKIDEVKVPIRSASLLFFRFGFLALLLVFQYEEKAVGKILLKRGDNCENQFCRVGLILLFGRDQQTGAALDKVYKPRRRLR